MTIEKPLWLGPNPTTGEVPEYPAQADRQILATLFTEGIGNVQAGHLAVTQRAAGANMTVEVAAGTVYITGDDVLGQGLYRTNITATESVSIGAAPASNSRIDLIVARVYDAQAVSGAKHGLYLEVEQGAAAATPTAPAVPPSAIALAQVLVTAGATSIVTANITDRRTQAGAATLKVGTQPQSLTTAQRDALTAAELFPGRFIFNITSGRLETYSGGQWVGAGLPQVDVFTASGTWTKPVGCSMVHVIVFGGGGGGALGRPAGGGAGGERVERWIPAALLPATVAVTVGAGGAGYRIVNANGQDVNAGTFSGAPGGTSSFGAASDPWSAVAGGGSGGPGANGNAPYWMGMGGAGGLTGPVLLPNVAPVAAGDSPWRTWINSSLFWNPTPAPTAGAPTWATTYQYNSGGTKVADGLNVGLGSPLGGPAGGGGTDSVACAGGDSGTWARGTGAAGSAATSSNGTSETGNSGASRSGTGRAGAGGGALRGVVGTGMTRVAGAGGIPAAGGGAMHPDGAVLNSGTWAGGDGGRGEVIVTAIF